MRNELKETLDEDKRLLTQARTVKGTSFMTLAELTLDDFVLQMETLSGRKFAAKGTQRLIARAHAIQSLVSEVPAFVTRGEVLQNHR